MNEKGFMQQSSTKSALILGFSILIGLATLGLTIGQSALKFKAFERTVTVKGLSEKEVPADIVLWPIHFSTANNELTTLYEEIDKDAQDIVTFLNSRGFEPGEITIAPPKISDKFSQGYEKSRIEFRYTAQRAVTVYSTKIELARAAMNQLASLGKKGIAFTGDNYQNATEYLFTRLNEIKPNMVEEATRAAREVAQKFAQDSDSRLGKIKSARQGQFSISMRDKNNPHIKRIRVVSTVEYYLSD